MPETLPRLPSSTFSGFLRDRLNDLSVHLTSSAPVHTPAGVKLEDIDFPGYKPVSHVFRLLPSQDGDNGVNLACRARFTRLENGVAAQAVGCYVSYTSPVGQRSNIYAAAFDRPVLFVDAMDSCSVELSIRGWQAFASTQSNLYISGISRVISWKGGSAMYALAGQDRALVQTTLAGLVALLRRDTTLGDLSDRSTRSRVPLVPIEDESLAAAVSMVRQRLELLLAPPTGNPSN